jgi:hypothetical protein
VSYQRKSDGLMVLRTKAASRSVSSAEMPSTAAASSSSPADGKSRFFDEGRKRETNNKGKQTPIAAASTKPNSAVTPKTKNNPTGEGYAFSWMSGSGTR